MARWSWWDTAIVVGLAWCAVGIVAVSTAQSRGRWWSRQSALVLAWIAWLLTGLSASERLPTVSWWLVVWAAETCAIVGYLVGRDNGDRAATRRIERDARERTDARERFARGQAEQVIKARRN